MAGVRTIGPKRAHGVERPQGRALPFPRTGGVPYAEAEYRRGRVGWASEGEGAITPALPALQELRLLAATRGGSDTAKPFEDKLIAAGLPKGRLARLLAERDALKAAIDTRAQNVLQRAAAGPTVIAQGRRAVQVLRLIDSLVQPLLRHDRGQLTAWGQAKRMGRGVGAAGEGVTTPDVPAAVVRAMSPESRPAADGGAEEVERAD